MLKFGIVGLLGLALASVCYASDDGISDVTLKSKAAIDLAKFLGATKMSCNSQNGKGKLNLFVTLSADSKSVLFHVDSDNIINAVDAVVEETPSFFVISEEVDPPSDVVLLIPGPMNAGKIEPGDSFDITVTSTGESWGDINAVEKYTCTFN